MPSKIYDSKIYIEFVGQHTAGKTSVIHDIVDRECLLPTKAIYPQKLNRSRTHFFLNLPLLFLNNIRNLCFICLFFLRYTKFTWINYHSAGRHMWKMVLLHPYHVKFNFDLWMKDDLLHLLPRIEFRNKVDVSDVFQMFFNHFSHLYDGLVYIDLPYEEMKERFKSRFESRSFRRKANRELVYDRAYKQNILLKEVLMNQNKVPILVLDGLVEVKNKSSMVVKFIKVNILEAA